MACDYLQLKHNYGHRGINHFLEFAAKRLDYVNEDNERYFQEMNQYFIDELKVDVLGLFGLEMVEDTETNQGVYPTSERQLKGQMCFEDYPGLIP